MLTVGGVFLLIPEMVFWGMYSYVPYVGFGFNMNIVQTVVFITLILKLLVLSALLFATGRHVSWTFTKMESQGALTARRNGVKLTRIVAVITALMLFDCFLFFTFLTMTGVESVDKGVQFALMIVWDISATPWQLAQIAMLTPPISAHNLSGRSVQERRAEAELLRTDYGIRVVVEADDIPAAIPSRPITRRTTPAVGGAMSQWESPTSLRSESV